MATRNYLAVDLGAESGRTIVGKFDGHRIDLQETHRFSKPPVRIFDTLYWDAPRLWHEIKTGIAATVQKVGIPSHLGIDTWGVDFGLLDQRGHLLGNPVCYRDDRTDGMEEAAFAMVSKQKIYDVTGLQFLKFNSLFQLMAHARQYGGQGRDPFAAASKFLFMPDLFGYFLTGAAKAEYTIASTSQMLDARSKTWASDMLGELGIPPTVLPELVETGTILGSLLEGVAAETGAKGTQVVATAGHDTAAAFVAVPAKTDKWCFISSGTWSLLGIEAPAPIITKASFEANFTNEGGIGGTIRFLKNIMGLWLVQQCRARFVASGSQHDYAELTEMAAASPAFGPIVNPDDESFFAPTDMPAAIANFCQKTGQQVPEGEAAIVRTCLESLALCYRRTVETIESITGEKRDVIHIGGGGSLNALLCQLAADCSQRPVVAGPVEATAMGNILVQAIASGEIADLSQAREVVRSSYPTRTYTPGPLGAWDDHYAKFRSFFSS